MVWQGKARLSAGLFVRPYVLQSWLEVHCQRELAEAALVIGATVIANPAFRRGNGHRATNRLDIRNVVQAFLDIEVMVIEDVEALCAENQVNPFMKRDCLAQRGVQVPPPGPAERIASRHVGW